MAVQKSRKSRSRTGKKRSHMSRKFKTPTLSTEPETGEKHIRHHISAKGFYCGRQVIVPKVKEHAGHDHEHDDHHAE